jgi:hypothetical protein
MQAELRTRLKDDATVSGLVGTRIDWITRPQGKALPAITLQTVSDPRPQHMGGNQDTRQTMVQADCWGGTYAASRGVADAVVACVLPAANVGNVRFLRSFVDNERDGAEETETGLVYRVSVDLRVTHTPIP